LLCIKIASRGDLLLAGPAFRLLRRGRPASHITLMVGRSCEDVARHLPFFDDIQVVDDHALLAGSLLEKAAGAFRMWRHLRHPSPSDRKETCSEALIFHRDWRYGLIARLARIPVCRGIVREGDFHVLTHPCLPKADEHHVEQYLKLVSASGNGIPFGTDDLKMSGVWHFSEHEREAALKVAASFGFDPSSGRWIALGFGGGRNVKTQTGLKSWPLASFRELAARLEKLGHRIAWVGDEDDARLLGQPETGVSLAGRLTVPETAAVLSACERVVSNDTLTLHLAEALGVPTFAIFGPTDPCHYRPRGPGSVYLQHPEGLACCPCHRDGWFPVCTQDHRCMKSVTPAAVLEKIREAR
jgi:ADP-heptose:LPS heptosyltransferase